MNSRDSFFEGLKDELLKLDAIFDEFCSSYYIDSFIRNTKKFLEDLSKNEADLLDRISVHIKRISSAIDQLESAISDNLVVKDINIVNYNLIDIINVSYSLHNRYLNLNLNSKKLDDMDNLLKLVVKSLNSLIEIYNQSHSPIMTVNEAFEQCVKNTPNSLLQ